jgi:hypothetical protein
MTTSGHLRSCWQSDYRCPECGSPLNTNGRVVWCTLVGSGSEKGCDYGIKESVPFDEACGKSNVEAERNR